jgi:hypothetical protein
MTVFSPYEHTGFIPFFERKERKFQNLSKHLGVGDKSKLKLMRKLTMIFEERFNLLYKFQKCQLKVALYFFVVKLINLKKWTSTYNDILSKRCSYCKQISKFSPTDRCFYPPIYKFFELEMDDELKNGLTPNNKVNYFLFLRILTRIITISMKSAF